MHQKQCNLSYQKVDRSSEFLRNVVFFIVHHIFAAKIYNIVKLHLHIFYSTWPWFAFRSSQLLISFVLPYQRIPWLSEHINNAAKVIQSIGHLCLNFPKPLKSIQKNDQSVIYLYIANTNCVFFFWIRFTFTGGQAFSM